MADETALDFREYVAGSGAAAIGARLRRLSERIDRDAGRFYAEFDVAFEQRWFGVLSLLSLYGPKPVGELAAALGVSHVSVSQVRQALVQAGLIAESRDPQDGRSRVLALTDAGLALTQRLAPAWRALSAAAMDLNAEAENALAALERLEAALDRASILDRAKQALDKA
jgi:DNA-binding MarR family transcriptional regulator